MGRFKMIKTNPIPLRLKGLIALPLRFLLVLSLGGCQTPFLIFPGGALNGESAQTESFAFAKSFAVLELETQGETPYSVILRSTVIDGELYIDAAPSRRWARNLEQSREVRIKLGTKIYSGIAHEVKDERLTRQFLPGRTLYRIEPVGKNLPPN